MAAVSVGSGSLLLLVPGLLAASGAVGWEFLVGLPRKRAALVNSLRKDIAKLS
jgi:hypothetical protein